MMLQSNTPHKPRLLALDDDRIILQSLSQFLSREGNNSPQIIVT